MIPNSHNLQAGGYPGWCITAPLLASNICRMMRQDGRGAELEEIQTQFVEQFCQVLRAADYCAVSRGEWEIAAAEHLTSHRLQGQPLFHTATVLQWHQILGEFLSSRLGGVSYPLFHRTRSIIHQ